jgi:ATP-dependent Clp protease ATP-binding subunit ClpC
MARRKDLSILLRRSAIQRQREAVRLKCDYVGAEHHLMGLLRIEEGNAVAILRRLGHSIEDLIRAAEKLARPVEDAPTSAEGLPVTFELQRAYRVMNEVAAELGHDTVSTEHLLMGLLSRTPNGKLGPLAAVMAEQGVVREDVEEAVRTWSGGSEEAA